MKNNYAIVHIDKDFEIIAIFENLEQIREYNEENEIKNDLVKVLDNKKDIYHGNIISYKDYYYRWKQLNIELENGNIDKDEFNTEFQEIKLEEKIDIEALKSTF